MGLGEWMDSAIGQWTGPWGRGLERPSLEPVWGRGCGPRCASKSHVGESDPPPAARTSLTTTRPPAVAGCPVCAPGNGAAGTRTPALRPLALCPGDCQVGCPAGTEAASSSYHSFRPRGVSRGLGGAKGTGCANGRSPSRSEPRLLRPWTRVCVHCPSAPALHMPRRPQGPVPLATSCAHLSIHVRLPAAPPPGALAFLCRRHSPSHSPAHPDLGPPLSPKPLKRKG